MNPFNVVTSSNPGDVGVFDVGDVSAVELVCDFSAISVLDVDVDVEAPFVPVGPEDAVRIVGKRP